MRKIETTDCGSIVFDEASNLSPKMVRELNRWERKRRASGAGWVNWYINRGHLPLNPSKRDLRRVSWRRAI